MLLLSDGVNVKEKLRTSLLIFYWIYIQTTDQHVQVESGAEAEKEEAETREKFWLSAIRGGSAAGPDRC